MAISEISRNCDEEDLENENGGKEDKLVKNKDKNDIHILK